MGWTKIKQYELYFTRASEPMTRGSLNGKRPFLGQGKVGLQRVTDQNYKRSNGKGCKQRGMESSGSLSVPKVPVLPGVAGFYQLAVTTLHKGVINFGSDKWKKYAVTFPITRFSWEIEQSLPDLQEGPGGVVSEDISEERGARLVDFQDLLNFWDYLHDGGRWWWGICT